MITGHIKTRLDYTDKEAQNYFYAAQDMLEGIKSWQVQIYVIMISRLLQFFLGTIPYNHAIVMFSF